VAIFYSPNACKKIYIHAAIIKFSKQAARYRQAVDKLDILIVIKTHSEVMLTRMADMQRDDFVNLLIFMFDK